MIIITSLFSLVVEHSLSKREVIGSIPVGGSLFLYHIKKKKKFYDISIILYIFLNLDNNKELYLSEKITTIKISLNLFLFSK